MKRKLEAGLATALIDHGYTHLESQVFRAPWSSTVVDHFVNLRWLEKYNLMISLEIGIRHRAAQNFAARMLEGLIGWPLELLPDERSNRSLIGFSLGKLCSWPDRWALNPTEMGLDACIGKIVSCLQDQLLPLIGDVKDDVNMYEFLTQIKIKALRPANGATCAAEAIFIGKRLGYSQSRVLMDIEPFMNYVNSQLNGSLTADNYLQQLWFHA